jgi:hypothetical protein
MVSDPSQYDHTEQAMAAGREPAFSDQYGPVGGAPDASQYNQVLMDDFDNANPSAYQQSPVAGEGGIQYGGLANAEGAGDEPPIAYSVGVY